MLYNILTRIPINFFTGLLPVIKDKTTSGSLSPLLSNAGKLHPRLIITCTLKLAGGGAEAGSFLPNENMVRRLIDNYKK